VKKYFFFLIATVLLIIGIDLIGQSADTILVNRSYYGKMLKNIFWDLGKSCKLDKNKPGICGSV